MTIFPYRTRHHLFTAVVAICTVLPAAAPVVAQRITVERADEWSELFHRTSGWSGADGAYSVALSGRHWFAHGRPPGPTLFLFGDTFIGDVDGQGRRLSGTRMINNSAAILRSAEPREDRITFHWGRDGNNPEALFIPDTPNAEPGDWYWPTDGVVVDRTVHIIAMRLRDGGGGGFNFQIVGVALISMPLDAPDPLREARQVEVPLFHPKVGEIESAVFGAAVMANTVEGGAPHPDGYIYVYGSRHIVLVKHMLAARIRPEEIEDPGAWRFWDGEMWQEDVVRSVKLAGRWSTEGSVVPLPDGRYLKVWTLDTVSQWMALRVGESPIGPWGPIRRVYRYPEIDRDPNIFIYGAKAHPHLSRPGELLVSYNVNTFDFWQHFREADIYRPRFVRLRIE